MSGAERERAYRERRRQKAGPGEFVEKVLAVYDEYQQKLTADEMLRAVKFLRETVLPGWERRLESGEEGSSEGLLPIE